MRSWGGYNLIMKIKYFLMAGAVAAFMSAGAYAQSVGYVDVQRLIAESPQYKKISDDLTKEFSARRLQIKKQDDAFTAEKRKTERRSAELSDNQRKTAVRKLRDMQLDVRRAKSQFQEDFTQRRKEELSKLQKIITTAIIDIAKQEQLDLVLQEAVFASKQIDLTAKVLRALQK